VTTVGLVGDNRAVEAIKAALNDTRDETAVMAVDPAAVGQTDITAVAATVDSSVFERVASGALETRTATVRVELGGVGGRAVADVDASISGYAPEMACYNCLRERIAAGEPDTDGGDCDDSTARLAGAIAGKELTALIEDDQSRLLGGVIELPYTQRRLLPVPHCACERGDVADTQLRRTSEDRPLEESITMAEVAFDERVGPIASVGEVESFPVPYYLATLSGTPFSDAAAPDHAAGVGLDWDPAFMKALGEALERYSAAMYRTAAFETAPESPIPPERFVDAEWMETDVTHWQEAEHLQTGEQVDVPASLTVFPPPERTIRPAITTGLGLGNGGVDSLCSGLYEVIERDATMLAWYSTYEPMGLAVDDEGYRTLASRAKSEGLEATALLLTQDIDVPVVAVSVHRETGWPKFAVGSAAALDPEAAARGALEEAIQNWLELRRMGPEDATEEGNIAVHAERPDVTQSFITPETTIPAAEVGPPEPPSGRSELEALIDRVEGAGLDAYGARLTPRDVEAMGFEATRVLVPSAQPLFTGDPYFGERARTVPESLGFEPRLDRTVHPFP
jgi:ribosomal protein S12 methylthiotransferase accessory factor